MPGISHRARGDGCLGRTRAESGEPGWKVTSACSVLSEASPRPRASSCRLSLALLGACAFITAACGTTPGSLGAPLTRPPDHAQDCPRLDSQLFQLSRSVDPERFASGAGLDLNSSGALVVVELAAGAEVPRGHGLDVEARYANLVQARVPLSELCALAQEPAVVSVAPPARGVPETVRP